MQKSQISGLFENDVFWFVLLCLCIVGVFRFSIWNSETFFSAINCILSVCRIQRTLENLHQILITEETPTQRDRYNFISQAARVFSKMSSKCKILTAAPVHSQNHEPSYNIFKNFKSSSFSHIINPQIYEYVLLKLGDDESVRATASASVRIPYVHDLPRPPHHEITHQNIDIVNPISNRSGLEGAYPARAQTPVLARIL